MKVAAVVLVVALIAVGNVAAKNRADRRELAAQDRVAVTTTMTSNVTEFGVQLILLFHNTGRAVRLLTPTVSAQGFTLLREDTPFPIDVAAGGEQAVALHLDAPCRDGNLTATVPSDPRVLVPAVPPSGKQHTIRVPFSDLPLSILGRQACGFLSADRSASPTFSNIVREKYAVSFTLRLQDNAAESLSLLALSGPGLAMSVTGGLPIDVAAFDDLILPARLTIPSCSQLPAELDPAGRATAYVAFSLRLLFQDGRRLTLPVQLLPGDPMLDAVRGLARSTCPQGSFRSGPGRRGGGVR